MTIDALREQLAAAGSPDLDRENMKLENLDPILEEVTYTKEHFEMIRSIRHSGRKPRKRLWHLKQERRRAKRFKIQLANLEIKSQAVDCLKDCPDPGACCRLIILNGDNPFGPFPRTESLEEAQQQLDEHGECNPFEIHAFGRTHAGHPIWYLRCKMVTREGACGIYEYRPELCRIFKACIDQPCLLHAKRGEAFDKYRANIERFITEEGTTNQP